MQTPADSLGTAKPFEVPTGNVALWRRRPCSACGSSRSERRRRRSGTTVAQERRRAFAPPPRDTGLPVLPLYGLLTRLRASDTGPRFAHRISPFCGGSVKRGFGRAGGQGSLTGRPRSRLAPVLPLYGFLSRPLSVAKHPCAWGYNQLFSPDASCHLDRWNSFPRPSSPSPQNLTPRQPRPEP